MVDSGNASPRRINKPIAPLSPAYTLRILCHTADLGNCAVRWHLSRTWAERVCEEAVAQTKREVAMELASSGKASARGSQSAPSPLLLSSLQSRARFSLQRAHCVRYIGERVHRGGARR
jgi:hypothetical protein